MSKEGYNLYNYVVAWVDLLGQTRKLERLFIPSAESERERAVVAARETFGHVARFRKTVVTMSQEMSKSVEYSSGTLNQLTPNQQSVLEKYNEVKVDVAFFSDSAVLAIPLRGTGDRPPYMSLMSMFEQLAFNKLLLLSLGIPIRAGVAVGICDYLESGELYGQGISRAHYCESVAGYPRIVIHPTFLTYLSSFDFTEFDPDDATYGKSMIQRVRSTIARDYDGRLVLSYLCQNFWEIFTKTKGYEELLKQICLFISDEIKKWSEIGDGKLVERYTMLREYFKKERRWV